MIEVEVLAGAFQGHSDAAYIRSISRYITNGHDMGTKYHSREFIVLVEEVAANLCRVARIQMVKAKLPGLGIASDFSLVFDSVSIGAKAFSTEETLELIGLRLSHPACGRLISFLIAAPSAGSSHQGHHKKELVLFALHSCPDGGVSLRRLRASLVVVAGDGQMTSGGIQAKHSSTKACEHIYSAVFPRLNYTLTWWDLFHREEIGGKLATNTVPYALEQWDVSNVLQQLFGVGSGRTILRGVAELFRDEKDAKQHLRPCNTSSTRPVAYSFRLCEAMYRNYQFYHGAIEARLQQTRCKTQTGGRQGSQSLSKLLSLSSRLLALDFVMFMLLSKDVANRILAPFAAATQSAQDEAVQTFGACLDVVSQLRADVASVEEIKFYVWLGVVMTPYLREQDLRLFYFVALYSKVGRKYPSFFKHIYSMLWNLRFQGCVLQWPMTEDTVDETRFHLLHAKCQCPTMTNRPPPGKCSMSVQPVGKAGFRRNVKLPSWVRQRLPPCLLPDWLADASADLRATFLECGLLNVLPRSRVLGIESNTPSYLTGISRFRKSGYGCRCVIPLHLGWNIIIIILFLFQIF